MKVFILAAGVGSRLSRFSQGKPKCLLNVGGKTLIKRLVEQFQKYNISDITLITGYKHELIMEELQDKVREAEEEMRRSKIRRSGEKREFESDMR